MGTTAGEVTAGAVACPKENASLTFVIPSEAEGSAVHSFCHHN